MKKTESHGDPMANSQGLPSAGLKPSVGGRDWPRRSQESTPATQMSLGNSLCGKDHKEVGEPNRANESLEIGQLQSKHMISHL